MLWLIKSIILALCKNNPCPALALIAQPDSADTSSAAPGKAHLEALVSAKVLPEIPEPSPKRLGAEFAE